MEIIGEKINGTRKRVGQAIIDRDAGFIKDLAKRQEEAGADFLDVNAGTKPDRETNDLLWLVNTIQEELDVPLCLDSANPGPLGAAIKEVKRTPMINSISGEVGRVEGILPLVAEHDCSVIALAISEKGIPKTLEERMVVIRQLIGETRKHGVQDEKVYVDPLVLTIATDIQAGRTTLDTIRSVKREFPDAHVISGLSNVSFGLPYRPLINRTFLTLAVEAGLDSAIIDPMDQDLAKTLLAAEMVLGKDHYCLNYTQAYREGRLGPIKEKAK